MDVQTELEKSINKAPKAKVIIPALLSKQEIEKAQDSIKRRLTTLDTDIKANVIQCVLHAQKHGDTSLTARLFGYLKATGYRTNGMLQWVRKHTPMEFLTDRIKLDGVDPKTGEKRPFDLEGLISSNWTDDNQFSELVKPVFQDVLLSPVSRQLKAFREAQANTDGGKPIDASKPYIIVDQADKLAEFWATVEAAMNKLPDDTARELFNARKALADAEKRAAEAAEKAA